MPIDPTHPPRSIFSTITERDIDLHLLQEIHATADFRRWLFSRCGIPYPHVATLIGAWHSVTEAALGESDLVVLAEAPHGDRHAILIEDKIDAAPQLEQAARYHERGESGIASGRWTHFSTLIIAPERYLESDWAEGYDGRISYEDIREHIAASDLEPGRKTYLSAMLDTAIDQNRRGYRPIVDPVVTAFKKRIHELVSSEFPELGMKEPRDVGSRSDWVHYRPQGLDKRCQLRHKLRAGRVDLEYPRCGHLVENMITKHPVLLASGLEILGVGGAAALSVAVPPVDSNADFADQSGAVRSGAMAAVRLWSVSLGLPWPEDG